MDPETLDQVNRFMAAAGDVLSVALRHAEAEAPGALAGLQHLAAAGGLLSVKATVGPSTGLAQLLVELTTPAGESHTLMACELQPIELHAPGGC